jgi:predicted transcriptional regulator of viral defense system
MAGILERLELDRPSLVSSDDLSRILEDEKISTPVRVIASRLREKGWLLPTTQRGVWEFAPAEVAGTISKNEPTIGFQSYLTKHPKALCALTFQAAAWAHGFSDRAPAKLEVATAHAGISKSLPPSLTPSIFVPVLPYVKRHGVPILAIESIFVHLASKPQDVRSWTSTAEWLPAFAAEMKWEQLAQELKERRSTVKARLGYILQALCPDLAERIFSLFPPGSKTWFGPRAKLKRHDNHWQIADTLLPFDPRKLEAVNE